MKLTGLQMQALCEALGDAYTIETLRMALRFRLGKDLDDYASPAPKPQRIFELVAAAECEDWAPQLLAMAREAKPDHSALAALGGEVGLTSTGKPSAALERKIRDNTPFENLRPWLEKWGQLETQVCRIEIYDGQGVVHYGTGALVAKDLVLTNHHVMAPVIDGTIAPSRVLCRFDYKRLSDGMTLNAGREVRLTAHGEWLLDSSPPSPTDKQMNGGQPDPDHLDYALIRLHDAVGNLPVGTNPEPGAPARGWIARPTVPPNAQPKDILFILQHPDREPLMLATGNVLSINGNGTRIRHDVNTENGSSGAPCFGADLSLVALHHAGDPNYPELKHPTYNQAIPLANILQRLEKRKISFA